MKRCTYYAHYQVYGLCELTHFGWHQAEQQGSEHFATCSWRGDGLCPQCANWERRLRA